MKLVELDELRQIQLSILEVIDEFCAKNNIVYYLTGGTLIGAIRHEGYIPWDDDIDISMFRSDYERFVNSFNEYSDKYQVFTAENCDWYPFPFAKVSDMDTLLIEEYDKFEKYDIGINVDVFPIDDCPSNPLELNFLMKRIKILRKMLAIKLLPIIPKQAFYKNVILSIGKILCKRISLNEIALRINDLAKRYNSIQMEKCGIIVWGYGQREIVNKSIFRKTCYVKFEEKNFPAPIGYHGWLTSVYGDYMELPPREKQRSHHEFKAFIKN